MGSDREDDERRSTAAQSTWPHESSVEQAISMAQRDTRRHDDATQGVGDTDVTVGDCHSGSSSGDTVFDGDCDKSDDLLLAGMAEIMREVSFDAGVSADRWRVMSPSPVEVAPKPFSHLA